MHFNPWWYSNTGELLTQFFERLGTDLEQESRLSGIKEKLLSYRKLIAPVGAVVDLFVSGGMVSTAAALASAAADRSTQLHEESSRDIHALRSDIVVRI